MKDFFKRLDTFMKYSNLNDNRITVETGIANGLIGKARKRGSLSQESISKILYRYRNLNARWLLTGEGEMLQAQSLEHCDEIIKFYKNLLAEKEERIEQISREIGCLQTIIDIKNREKE